MNAEFNWWLLIVGIGVGAGLAWLILADLTRRDDDIVEGELADEVAWVVEALAASGRPTSPETIERVLRLHRAYLQRERSEPPGDVEGGAKDPTAGA